MALRVACRPAWAYVVAMYCTYPARRAQCAASQPVAALACSGVDIASMRGTVEPGADAWAMKASATSRGMSSSLGVRCATLSPQAQNSGKYGPSAAPEGVVMMLCPASGTHVAHWLAALAPGASTSMAAVRPCMICASAVGVLCSSKPTSLPPAWWSTARYPRLGPTMMLSSSQLGQLSSGRYEANMAEV